MKTIIIKYSCLSLLAFLLSGPVHAQSDIPPEFCITQAEHKLSRLINNHRVLNGLPELSLSKSLSFVAVTHVADLVNNHPDTGICNLNSWSDKGEWTPCCHSKYFPRPECIFGKPGELTDYKGDGHELVYWEFSDAIPDSVFIFWSGLDETNDFLLNKGKWNKYKWKSMGVSILEGYAVVWFGELSDNAGEPTVCVRVKKEPEPSAPEKPWEITVIDHKTGRYYVFCASYSLKIDAENDVRKYLSKGYPESKVVISNKNYRVSLYDHETLDSAKKYKAGLGDEFKNVWIMRY